MKTLKDIGRENAAAANEELYRRSLQNAAQRQSDLISDVTEELKDIKTLLNKILQLLQDKL